MGTGAVPVEQSLLRRGWQPQLDPAVGPHREQQRDPDERHRSQPQRAAAHRPGRDQPHRGGDRYLPRGRGQVRKRHVSRRYRVAVGIPALAGVPDRAAVAAAGRPAGVLPALINALAPDALRGRYNAAHRRPYRTN